jgi:hypothetical protein
MEGRKADTTLGSWPGDCKFDSYLCNQGTDAVYRDVFRASERLLAKVEKSEFAGSYLFRFSTCQVAGVYW